MCRLSLAAVLVFSVVLLHASEPGQPLSHEDWVIALPGLSAQPGVEWASACPTMWDFLACPELACMAGSGTDAADGSGYYALTQLGPPLCEENAAGHACFRNEIRRYSRSGQTETVAYIEDRPGAPSKTRDVPDSITLRVDATNGILYVGWYPICRDDNDGVNDCLYQSWPEVMKITGLPTMFEVLQTYTPSGNEIGFRVPYMPEGFQYADYFDTYYGDLATLGDWSQAQALQCEYPASAPSMGDYLTVEDTLPTPVPGTGYYYVTAVNYMGLPRFCGHPV